MPHITSRETWGTVDVDLQKGHILVREDWRYEWASRGEVPARTSDEKDSYHRSVDHLGWAFWSFRARIQVGATGTPGTGAPENLVSKFGRTGLTLSFDIRRVKNQAQWNAIVTKVDPNIHPHPRAKVWFEAKRLQLFSTDILPHVAQRFGGDPQARPDFSVTGHEFGHTLGYVYARGSGEEREANHKYFRDTASIMNIGRAVRPRHLALITETLARMVPGCRFNAIVTS